MLELKHRWFSLPLLAVALVCGDNRVMWEDSVAFMQVDRGGEFGGK